MKGVGLAGERCDPETIKWLRKHMPKTIINDTWWQTETGWPITGNLMNEDNFGPVFPTLPGSVTKPMVGFDVQILDENNE